MKNLFSCYWTKKLLLGLVVLQLFTHLQAQDTLFFNRLGYQQGSHENASPYFEKALDLIQSSHYKVLICPKGRYDFWQTPTTKRTLFESNTDQIPFRNCAVLIEHQQGLSIDAQGSDFIFHGRIQPFTIFDSRDITIKNVHIDWDIPMTAQAEVVAVSDHSIDLKINSVESPYRIRNGKLFFVGEDWESQFWDAMEFDRVTKLIVPQTADNCLGENWTNYTALEIDKGRVRLQFEFSRKPAVGNYLVLRHSARDHAGTFIDHSKNIQLENVYLYQTAGLGILSQYSENLSFRNVNFIPNAKKGRIFSGHDDGLHFSNCKGKIEVDSCAFSGLMDDPINVHGTSVLITDKLNTRELKCKLVHPQSIGFTWAEANNNIGFIENESMQTVGGGRVASFKKISDEEFQLEFFENIPVAIKAGDALENLSWTPDLQIRNSYFGSNRARGILISTPGNVLVEHNVFESSGSAILIPGDANGWYESGAVKNVLIRNNIFKEACLTSLYQFCEAIISIDPEIPKPEFDKPFHQNIRIENNEFYPFDFPILYAKSTSGLVFSNNKIQRSKKYTSFHSRKFMISLETCKKIEIRKNQFIGDVLGKNLLLKRTPRMELKLEQNLKVTIED